MCHFSLVKLNSRRPCQGPMNNKKKLYHVICSLLFFVLLAAGAEGYCVSQKKTAYSGELTFSYPRNTFKPYYSYDINQFCEITFESYYNGDGVKLVFDRVDLEPPRLSGDYSTCQDKIVVYDGPSYSDPLLTTLCGMRTVTLESKDSSLLLVFSSDGYKNGAHLGFSVSYSSIDRGGSDSASGVGAGTLVAIILPCLFIYALLFFVVYKRCKYAQRVRQNLAATGHTPEDIRMAMATMVDQASRRPLTSTVGSNGHEGNANMTQILRQHMDASRDRRLGQGGGGDGRHQRRVRHPAGDRYSDGRDASPFVPPRVAVQDDSDLHGSRQGSLHSLPVDNQHYGQHLQHHHPQRDIEDDRHSHGSSRSGRSRGQRTPSPHPYYHDRGGNDSTTLTYYGIVDRHGDIPASAASPSAPSYRDVVQPGRDGVEPPPPSYEEAATGKYDP